MDARTLMLRWATVTVALSGCAGARGSVAFNKLEYPVSMSSYVEQPSGRVLSPKEMKIVGEVNYQTKVWGMGYSAIPLSGEKDVSTPINEQVRSAGGEGVCELSVEADYCALNHVPVLNFLPIWPSCVDVSIHGKIFRGEAAPTPVPAPATTAPNAGVASWPGAAQRAPEVLPAVNPAASAN